jgi:uncharacterized protein (TIGR02453 family)
MSRQAYFSPELFKFLRELKQNNSRDWFQTNKQRYEEVVKQPALRFITDFGPQLNKISKHFRTDPRPVGGSLFRIYRDVRFSKNKDPYKTAVGIHFRHEAGKNAHAPGFYLHLEPGGSFCGLGIWCPETPPLTKIRQAIAREPAAWRRAVDGRRFKSAYTMESESLKRVPRGFPADHPLAEDLKRKSYTGLAKLTQREATSADFPQKLGRLYQAGAPLVKFLCQALDVKY